MAATSTRAHGSKWLPERPMSVEQIVDHAGKPFFDPQFSIKNWFRTSESMVKQANIYEHENNDQTAYFLLYRHASLILDELPKHPHAKDAEFRKLWTEARKSVAKSLAKLEVLKPRINKRYRQHEERKKKKKKQSTAAAPPPPLPLAASSSTHIEVEESPSEVQSKTPEPDSEYSQLFELDRGPSSAHTLDASQHKDMAVQLVNRRYSKPNTNINRDGSTAHVENEQEWDISRDLMQARRQVELNSTGRSAIPKQSQSALSDFKYPKVPQLHDISKQSSGSLDPPSESFQQYRNSNTPPQPFSSQQQPPPLPRKDLNTASSTTAVSMRSSPEPEVTVRQFSSFSRLEDGSPLRTIFLPSLLRHSFVKVAAHNTSLHLETCGILCGTLLRNAFFITKLVIPEQISTSDTCEMVNETALYEYCDSQPEELMVLGWIHTHPTQTCFMSSRDLHTHCWYQVSLAESIAIVCSPTKDPDWGIFRLTDPPGMQAITSCKLPGIFHPHAETQLYTDTLGRPGHVVEHEQLQFEVVDLRNKS